MASSFGNQIDATSTPIDTDPGPSLPCEDERLLSHMERLAIPSEHPSLETSTSVLQDDPPHGHPVTSPPTSESPNKSLSTTAQGFPFLDLPGELRNSVYEEHLPIVTKGQLVFGDVDIVLRIKPNGLIVEPDLAVTCRQIRKEIEGFQWRKALSKALHSSGIIHAQALPFEYDWIRYRIRVLSHHFGVSYQGLTDRVLVTHLRPEQPVPKPNLYLDWDRAPFPMSSGVNVPNGSVRCVEDTVGQSFWLTSSNSVFFMHGSKTVASSDIQPYLPPSITFDDYRFGLNLRLGIGEPVVLESSDSTAPRV
ncbi:hypothetical protein M011DRAFT_459624 [Sporormia fimetaria CBS 119925]|uniref:Uncharacterized protein n=1 Tax=Sporormia fimetaria CBS 119925 TaxID=1340428 RepID=A0A6A6V8R1_9PLEO|nr:hypothetical protein M011DRAFT_459624 [Sporormia fimetaria CBS 119925]